jgi:hypothetical protein
VSLRISHPNKYLKPEHVGKWIEVDYSDRSSVVKAFMGVFLVREYSRREAAVITRFLRRKGLTRAEVHGVMLHLGFRYSTINASLARIAIDGYCDRKPCWIQRGRPKGSKTKKPRTWDWYESRGF